MSKEKYSILIAPDEVPLSSSLRGVHAKFEAVISEIGDRYTNVGVPVPYFLRLLRRPPQYFGGLLAMTVSFRVLSFLILFFTCVLSLANAQEPSLQPSPPQPAASPSAPTSEGLYLDFKGAALINVLTVLSELSGINYVAGKEVADRQVNMVLDEVTLEDALEAIARGTNVVYDFLPQRNIYLFRASAYGAELPPLLTRVFKLYYIRATKIREIEGEGGSSGSGSTSGTTFSVLKETEGGEEESSPILQIVESMLSERGHVKIDDRSNSLVVTDTEDRLRMVEQAITELDRSVDQVLISAMLIETFEDLDRHLGIDWGQQTDGAVLTVTPGSQPTRFPFNINDALPGFFDTPLDKNDITAAAAGETITRGTKSFAQLVVEFKQLQAEGKLRIIAKPKILVLDNHPALIKITTNQAITSQTTQTAAEGIAATTSTAERTETGTSLRVTPLINTDGRITMTLEPRFVTAAASGINVGAAAALDPTIRTARTTMMVNDGQTIVIGGLLDSRQQNTVQRVPFLGDIPWVGEIFTRRTRTIDDRELVLFVTPNIIRDPSEVQAVSVPDYRDRFDDVTAPFWKVKRKNWYRDLKNELPPEGVETEVEIVARDRVMDKAFQKLTFESQAGETNVPPSQDQTDQAVV